MASSKDETPTAPAFDQEAFAASIAKGITDANNATGPIKQIPVTKYKNKNIYNPLGLVPAKRPQFDRAYYQNGRQLTADTQYPADIAALALLKPGRYLDRKVEVIERVNETGDGNEIEIRYPSATSEQRMEMKNVFRTFSELLRLILAEQDAAAVGG